MTRLQARRPRPSARPRHRPVDDSVLARSSPAFVHAPLPFRRRRARTALCRATASQPNAETDAKAATEPPTDGATNAANLRVEHMLRTRMQGARQRVRVLNARVVVRIAEGGIRIAQAALSDEQLPQVSDAGARDDEVITRLKRDLKNLSRVADDYHVRDDTAEVISRLSNVVEAVERAVQKRRASRVVADLDPNAFVGDNVEDGLEDAFMPVDDLQWNGDHVENGGSAQVDAKDADESGIVDNVRRSIIEQGNELKRRASHVGAGIEEKVSEFVKDDGSIDVDGLRSYVRNILDTAGMTWQRLNGIVPTAEERKGDDAVEVKSASLQVRDEEKEFHLREEIGELEKRLIASSKQREAMLRNEDQLGKLIRAKEIRLMDDGVSVLRRTLAVKVLQLEMEKIFVSIADEIENSDYEIMMDQRVLVAEFGDLDSRLATLELFIDENEPLLIEDDTLGGLAADIQDLKMRLGIDEPLYSSATLNWAQLRQFFVSSARKTRAGAEFYSRGLRLFAGDVRFAMRLIRRAITGYNPSPREVRTLRRTGKDLLTLIPFTIVLIAPLTPVGHVLIFSFLQRYWPEFFPSTFSERRQSVMKRHEQYQKAMQSENGENGNNDNGIAAEGGSEHERGGPIATLRRLLLYGALANETSELKGNGVEESAAGRLNPTAEVGDVSAAATAGSTGVSSEGELHPLALEDIAGVAADGERDLQKRGRSVGLDDLHLAD